MKSLKFSEQEIELLIAMYEDELKEVTEYSERLRETLGKLRSESSPKEVAPVREGKKRGRKPGSKSGKVTTGKKRGRKPKNAQPAETVQPEVSAAPKTIAEKKKAKKTSLKSKSKRKAGKPALKTEVKPAISELSAEPVV